MTDRLSNKFRWLSLIATWAVVCIHSRTDRWAVGTVDFATKVEAHVANLFHFAVPLFFAFSGYMFVHSYKKYGWNNLLRRKFWSLYVPVVIWSIVGLIVCLPIRIYSHNDIPTILDCLKLPMLIFRSESVHFWYVRALIFFALIAPVVFFISKRTWLAVAAMLCTILIPENSFAARQHFPVSFFYFMLGAVGGQEGFRFHKQRHLLFVVCLIGLILSFVFKDQIPEHYFVVLCEPLFMIGVLWFGYDVVNADHLLGTFPARFNVLFFVYCMHLITLCWFGGILRIYLGGGAQARLCGYVLLALTFWVDVGVANAIRRLLPKVFQVLSGNR